MNTKSKHEEIIIYTNGIYCSKGNEYCKMLMDKYCRLYQQNLMFDNDKLEYERCSRCLINKEPLWFKLELGREKEKES